MSILNKIDRHFPNDGTVTSMTSLDNAIAVLSRDNEYVDKVLDCFSIDMNNEKVIQIGNVKALLEDISHLDSMAIKKDVRVKIRNIVLDKMLEREAALFTLYEITDPDLIKKLQADHIQVESRYSAKDDVLDAYKLSKFANYCRDCNWADLLDYIQKYIKANTKNDDYCSARLIKPVDCDRYLLRAITSDKVYRNYGINFSIMVALLAVNRYVINTKSNVFIDSYQLDDSRVYLSFKLGKSVKIDDNLDLSFSMILENDEIKDSSVSFSGIFQLAYNQGDRSTHITLRPRAFHHTDQVSYNTDMVSYTHSMTIERVYNKINELPFYIEKYVKQVSEYAKAIIKIQNPEDVRSFIMDAVSKAKNNEFAKYKPEVLRTLASIDSNSIFSLFEALRSVDELLSDDIASREYWRMKLFNLLFYRGKDNM